MHHAFVTGFPGFIASRLARRLAGEVSRLTLLVEERFEGSARQSAQEMAARFPSASIEVVRGDITRPGLGLDPEVGDRLVEEVDEVFHLAAIYDLAVDLELARLVNVEGTRHVNDFVLEASRRGALRGYDYVSTVVVSGDRRSTVLETELDVGQGFDNHYERTKFEAELLVEELKPRLPVRIFRPAVVVGDSVSGETVKFDGPYNTLKFLDRLGFPFNRVNFGSRRVHLNVVPVDFVVAALVRLAADDRAAGRTFHLACDSPPSTSEMTSEFLFHYQGARPWCHFPLGLLKAITLVPGSRYLLGVHPSFFSYLFKSPSYDTTNTRELLAGTGITCPSFPEYSGSLVRYFVSVRGDGTCDAPVRRSCRGSPEADNESS